ncbi:DMT family transporter [Streptomyces sp. SCA3-4]|uniref:DMT family transporter n=1 Tax=Streptomyces sichuanensis TaxID=2871810 RepID=UPI001CE2F5BC|nr:DMT family transporter [Streptomyces sichuanensis]MCA6091124.1 DMT family transporter [Streptomyces sichuanensis]
MSMVLAVVFAVLTSLSNGLATVLQRKAARTTPEADALHARLMLRLMRQPVWFAGIAAVICAAVCQALALRWGPLALVQPVFVIELPLALLIGSLVLHRRLSPRGWGAVAAVAGGAGLALAAAAPSGGRAPQSAAHWAAALACTGLAVAGCVAAAATCPAGKARAALFGAAAAIAYAVTAALMKTAVIRFGEQGVVAFFTAWQTYAFAAAGVCALFLLSNAMAAGPLVASQPALTLGDALVSLTLGIVLYAEDVRSGWWLLPEAVGVLLVLAGTLVLAGVQQE